MTSNTIKIKSVKMSYVGCGFYEAIATSADNRKYQYACKINNVESVSFRERVISAGEISSLTWLAL